MNSKLPVVAKQQNRTPYPSQQGQGLIEALLGLGIILLLFHALGSLVITSYDLLGNSRTRSTARHIANEKMEIIRNIPYDSVGVLAGIPPGIIPQIETTERNGLTYTIRNSVIFIDDEFDSLAPTDPYPTDYKRIRVDVSWTGRFVAGESITMISDLSSGETVGGGTLSILVFDSYAQPVPQANVHIVNTAVSPQIDVWQLTSDEGIVTLPGTPVCNTCYQISATKDGFSMDKTYTSLEVTNPIKPPASVIEAMLTEISFTIDRTSTMNITSTQGRASNFAVMPFQTFILRGNKIIGTDSLGDPVYKYQQQLVTNAAGVKNVYNLEWDSYQILLRDIDTRDVAGTNPLRPVVLLPASILDVLLATVPESVNSLLLAVTEASNSAIASASAHLTGPASYDEVIYTGEPDDPDFGQAFFPSLNTGTYNLQITKPGFEPRSESVEVSGKTEFTTYLDIL